MYQIGQSLLRPLKYTVPYPKLFWSWYTSLGSQTQTPKLSKLKKLINIKQTNDRSCDVLHYSECKIAKTFKGWGGGGWEWGRSTREDSQLTLTPQLCTIFFLATLNENRHPQKIAGYSTDMVVLIGVCLVKQIHKTTIGQIWSFWTSFWWFFPRVNILYIE